MRASAQSPHAVLAAVRTAHIRGARFGELPHMCRCELQGDSELAIFSTLGRRQCSRDLQPLSRACREALHALASAMSPGFSTGRAELLHWVPRRLNEAADGLARHGAQVQTPEASWIPLSAAVLCEAGPELFLRGGFDGACRTNPGPAGTGAWLDVVVANTPHRIWQSAIPLGNGTNNVAEFAGLLSLLLAATEVFANADPIGAHVPVRRILPFSA